MDDSGIVELYYSRSESAIRESSKKYGRYCGFIAKNILGSAEDSEECLNDTWLHAWNSIPPAKPVSLKGFLGKITRNLALSRLEKLSAQKRGGGELTQALEELNECISPERSETRLERAELSRIINAFLQSEERENAVLFMKRYWYLVPIGALSKELRLSESAVKMRLSRMRGRLREQLNKEGYDI